MKTVAVVARELETTPKTVYKWLNRVKPGVTESSTEVKPGETDFSKLTLTVKSGAITYITEDGERYLKYCMGKEVKPSVTENSTKVKPGNTEVKPVTPPVHPNIEEILFLREQVKLATDQNIRLNEELNKEREHSRAIADRLATITENQQKLLGMEQVKTTPTALMGESHAESAESIEKKNGILWRIFGR